VKPLRDRLVIPAAATLLLGFSSIGAAQPALSGAQAGEPVEAVQTPAPDYGTSSQIVQKVGITEFLGGGATYFLTVSNTGKIHYYQSAPATQNDWWAQVMLPAGAVIDSVELDGCDSSATGQFLFGMARAGTGGGAGAGNITPVGATGVATTPGCSLVSVAPFVTQVVDNENYNYWLFVDWAGDFTVAVKAAGMRVRYHLQVSPAPAVASFTDVPTNYWAFQYIEALKASGITGGVTPTTYEPESPVTRAQMAVFLAKALGLHFPN